MRIRPLVIAGVLLMVIMLPESAALSQSAPTSQLAEQDHQRMMALLGIESLRRGPDGNPNSPNAANSDESKANKYPNLPEALVLNDGRRVTTSQQWWELRRPEIVELFDREVYGRVPKEVPAVKWEVASTKNDSVGGIPVVTKQLVGRVDNSACPSIEVAIQLTL